MLIHTRAGPSVPVSGLTSKVELKKGYWEKERNGEFPQKAETTKTQGLQKSLGETIRQIESSTTT